MKQIGKIFFRYMITAVVILVVVMFAVPQYHAVVAAPSATSDDFNTCSIDPNFWTPEGFDKVPGASQGITGAYTGSSALTMSVPAGASYTFSNDNTLAPRIWHALTSTDFNYKVKYNGMTLEPSDNWRMQGILVRDNHDPAHPRYFRIEYDTQKGVLNRYVAYLGSTGFVHIIGPTSAFSVPYTTGALFLTVQKTGNSIMVVWETNGASARTFTFDPTTYDATFSPTDIGLFVASTGATSTTGSAAPGHSVSIDYIQDLNETTFVNDAIKLTINPSQGTGTGKVTQACTGVNQVTLTAQADAGSQFAGWSGDLTGTNPTAPLTMNASKTVTATFNTGAPVIYNFHIMLPVVEKQ